MDLYVTGNVIANGLISNGNTTTEGAIRGNQDKIQVYHNGAWMDAGGGSLPDGTSPGQLLEWDGSAWGHKII